MGNFVAKAGLAHELFTGVIAAGGTLGIMIPPSTIMVIYGIVTETTIGNSRHLRGRREPAGSLLPA